MNPVNAQSPRGRQLRRRYGVEHRQTSHTLEITSPEQQGGEPAVTYVGLIEGTVTPSSGTAGPEELSTSTFGGYMAFSGYVRGATDQWTLEGDLKAFKIRSDVSSTVRLDGSEVAPQDLVSQVSMRTVTPRQLPDHTVAITSPNNPGGPEPRSTYLGLIQGEASVSSSTAGPEELVTEPVDGLVAFTGYVRGATDEWTLRGDLKDFRSAEGRPLTVTHNGSSTDPGSLPGEISDSPGPSNEPPVPQFTVSRTGLQVQVDASGSTDPDGEVVAYDWDFGDGTVRSGQSVSHTYGSAGEYQITLSVTDDADATATTTRTVTVSPQQDGDNGGDGGGSGGVDNRAQAAILGVVAAVALDVAIDAAG